MGKETGSTRAGGSQPLVCFHLNFFFPFSSRLPLKIHFFEPHFERETFHTPAAVPQQSGTHQAEEKILVMTSGGNRVMFLCT